MPTAVDIAAWLDEELDAARYRVEEPENGLVVDAGGDGDADRVRREHDLPLDRARRRGRRAAAARPSPLVVVHRPRPARAQARRARRMPACRCTAPTPRSTARPPTGPATSWPALLGITVEGRFAPYEGSLAGVHGTFEGGWDAPGRDDRGRRSGEAPEAYRNASAVGQVGIVTGAGGMTMWLEEAIGARLRHVHHRRGQHVHAALRARGRASTCCWAGMTSRSGRGSRRSGERTAERFGLEHRFIEEPHIG